MGLFNSLKISHKILLVFAISFLSFLAVAIYTVIGSNRILELTGEQNISYIAYRDIENLVKKMDEMGKLFSDAISFKDDTKLGRIKSVAKEFHDLLDHIETVTNGDKERIEDMRRSFVSFNTIGKKIVKRLVSTGNFADIQDDFVRFGETSSQLLKGLKDYKEERDRIFNTGIQKLNINTRNIMWVTIIMSIAAVLISLFLTILLIRMITHPIKALSGALKDIAEGDGDLTKRIEIKSNDEIGGLARDFNTFVEKLHHIISEVADATHLVASAAIELSSSSEEMAGGADRQTNQTIEVANAMEEMSKTVVEVAKNSAKASEVSMNAMKTAENGGEVVTKTITGMRRVSSSVEESAKIIDTLGKASDHIGEIVRVIEEIADQTNLLALNAAIEAARAGDQGRGFAVVADEVRKLAERTTKATKEIGGMIKEIQQDTSEAVRSMGLGTKEVIEGVEMANKAGESLTRIVEMVNQATDMVQHIAVAAEEQSAAVEEISSRIESVANVSKETLAGAQQSSHACNQLSKLAVDLQNIVGRFKLGKDGKGVIKGSPSEIDLDSNRGAGRDKIVPLRRTA